MITEWQRAHALLLATLAAGDRQQTLDALKATIAAYQRLESSTTAGGSEWIKDWSFSPLQVTTDREVITRVLYHGVCLAELLLAEDSLFEPGGCWVSLAAPPISLSGQLTKHQPRKNADPHENNDPVLLRWQSLLDGDAIKLVRVEAATNSGEQMRLGARFGAERWLTALERGEPLTEKPSGRETQ